MGSNMPLLFNMQCILKTSNPYVAALYFMLQFSSTLSYTNKVPAVKVKCICCIPATYFSQNYCQLEKIIPKEKDSREKKEITGCPPEAQAHSQHWACFIEHHGENSKLSFSKNSCARNIMVTILIIFLLACVTDDDSHLTLRHCSTSVSNPFCKLVKAALLP